MGAIVSNKRGTWISPDDIKLVDGLITITNLTSADDLTLGDIYHIKEDPDNGRDLGHQPLTKLAGNIATFSKPSCR
jgi:hypothetical protein